MTALEMLTKVRTMLDEVEPEGMWKNFEIYSSLTSGQEAYASMVFAQYKGKAALNINEPVPQVLSPLIIDMTTAIPDATSRLNNPADLWDYISLLYNHQSATAGLIPMYKRETNGRYNAISGNKYLQGDTVNDYYYTLASDGIRLETPVSNVDGGQIRIIYLEKPTKIVIDPDATDPAVATIQPILPSFTHDAICTYAFSDMCNKIKMYEVAAQYYQKFLNMVEYI